MTQETPFSGICLAHNGQFGKQEYERSVIESVNKALFLERTAVELFRTGRAYEAGITWADADDAWVTAKLAIETVRRLVPAKEPC